MNKKGDLKKSKSKTKQKQKQKQNVVININSHNKRASKKDGPITSKPSSAPNIPNVQPPQYITRGMPPTINNAPPVAVPDMGKILSQMAEMNSNYSGIGGLNTIVKGINDRQSALETRLTEQYGLQNDFNNEQAHFNNQARDFFTANAYVAPMPSVPPMFIGGGVYQQPILNPFLADDVSTIGSDVFSQDNIDWDNVSQFTDNTESNNNLLAEITNALNDDPAFQPQTNIQPVVEKDPVEDQRINDLQKQYEEDQRNQELIVAREEAIQRKADAKLLKDQEAEKDPGRVAKQEDGDILQPSLAREAHEGKQLDLEKQSEISKNAMVGYDAPDDILKDYEWFMGSIQKSTGKKTMNGDELKVYNKLMKVGTNSHVKGDAGNIKRTTARTNIEKRGDDIKEFVKRNNQTKQPLPDNKQAEYVPLDERTLTMADLTKASGTEPTTGGLLFA